MSDDRLSKYTATDTKLNDLKALPDEVQAQLNAHLELYKKDPEGAHYWDASVVNAPGIVKCLMLTYTGRKSGRTLQTVLQYYEKDGVVAVVASRGGTEEHPVWYRNLLENADCEVQIARRRYRGRARTIEGPGRPDWWAFVVSEQPVQAVYQARTARQIPIVALDVVEELPPA